MASPRIKGPREIADAIIKDARAGKLLKLDIDLVRQRIRDAGEVPHEALENNILRRVLGALM